MKKVKEYAKEVVDAVAQGAQPYQARLDVLQDTSFSVAECAAFRTHYEQLHIKHLQDLRFAAEVLFKHVIKLDGGECIKQSKEMFAELIGVEL
jgi:hypothetical protein